MVSMNYEPNTVVISIVCSSSSTKARLWCVRDGIYELRTEYGGNIYRVFFIFDEGEIVVLFNGFQKKTQKTPQNEIEKAIKIKEAYYADKQSQNR